jgi:uncharacterized protein (DUF1499 family)
MSSKTWLYLFLGAIALYGLILILVALVSKRPDNLGVENGELAPCPASPNCVSSQSDDEEHGMQPLTYTGSREEAHARLLDVILRMPRTRIVTTRADYVYAEFRTFTFRFVDDVEFYLPADKKVIHFRSASRLGYSDMGVNRRRMEAIRDAFAQRP